ncbi:unnamed protein product [Rangifer tarandus platyrhynchus]|uniref:Uncharacterized protein n=1 Tax=Rangifer tarandus platyrhynchus TaxID=3082113 RepID=A0AC60A5W9_RANTA
MKSRNDLRKAEFPGCGSSASKGPRPAPAWHWGPTQGLELQSSECAAAVLEPAVLSSLSDKMLMAAGGGRQPTVHQAPLPRGLPDKSSLPSAAASIKVSFSLETPGIILKSTPG